MWHYYLLFAGLYTFVWMMSCIAQYAATSSKLITTPISYFTPPERQLTMRNVFVLSGLTTSWPSGPIRQAKRWIYLSSRSTLNTPAF